MDARTRFATELAADPSAHFSVPMTPAGYPITYRMGVAEPLGCEVVLKMAVAP